MTASDGFAEFLRDQLAPLGRITLRRMFGKTGVFCDGVHAWMVSGCRPEAPLSLGPRARRVMQVRLDLIYFRSKRFVKARRR